jgi:F-type H+-transporting ATPase subunit delta
MTSKKLSGILIKAYEKQENADTIKNFLTFVHKNKLDYLLPNVLLHVKRYEKVHQGAGVCILRTIEAFSKDMHKDIKKKIGLDASVHVEEVVDKSIIGGFIVEYNHVQYDASMVSALRQLKNHLQAQA